MALPCFDSMVGASAAMLRVFALIERLAPSDLTVLVLGETGTGKELVARSLHRRGRRAAGPFVALNCAAIPTTLIESELFGVERGAYTGAVTSHPGAVERAGGGTLFLDEIAELPLGVQSKLLRVVQERSVQRLGGTKSKSVDVRFVAATHQDVAHCVETGGFRRDLFHRLDEARLQLPPLRERGGDVDLLADVILERCAADLERPIRLTEPARAALHGHAWPGNVRELENCLRRAATLATGGVIEAAALGLQSPSPRTLATIVDRAIEAAIRDSLRRHASASEAAAELGLSVDELHAHATRLGVVAGRVEERNA
jgi:transcriptional regulator with PAS, ATPase and Fis domain